MFLQKMILAAMLSCHMAAGGQQPGLPVYIQLSRTASGFAERSGNLDTDVIGSWHNEALAYSLDQLAGSPLTPNDAGYAQLFTSSLTEFCQTKGISVQISFDGDFRKFVKDAENDMCQGNEQMSAAARSLLCRINAKISDFVNERESLINFNREMESMRLEAESLPDETERKICGITAATAKHSIQFWTSNFDYYYELFRSRMQAGTEKDTDRRSGPNSTFAEADRETFRIRWWAVGTSDALGAWRWGRVGAVAGGGAPGAVACGLAGAAAHSLGSLIGQAGLSLF